MAPDLHPFLIWHPARILLKSLHDTVQPELVNVNKEFKGLDVIKIQLEKRVTFILYAPIAFS